MTEPTICSDCANVSAREHWTQFRPRCMKARRSYIYSFPHPEDYEYCANINAGKCPDFRRSQEARHAA